MLSFSHFPNDDDVNNNGDNDDDDDNGKKIVESRSEIKVHSIIIQSIQMEAILLRKWH